MDNTTNNFKLKDQDEIKNLAKELKKPESAAYLDEMRQLAESPEYQKTTPPDTQATLKDAITRAEGLYNERATTNDWLEVAQTLGRAVAQFGAAQHGQQTGRDMSNLNMGGTIDYGARTDRALRESQNSIRQAGDLADRTRQGWQDEEATKKGNYGQREDYLKSALKNAQEVEGDEARFKRQQTLDSQRDSRTKSQSDLAERKFEDSKLASEEVSLAKQLQQARTLANQVINDPEVSKKSRDRIKEKYASSAAAAGIDPEVLADIAEQSKDEGVLGTGFFRGEKKEKNAAGKEVPVKSRLIEEQVIGPIKTMLDSVKQKREALRSRQAGQPVSQSNGTPSENTQPRMVTVVHKATGAIKQYPEDAPEVANAKNNPEFEVK